MHTSALKHFTPNHLLHDYTQAPTYSHIKEELSTIQAHGRWTKCHTNKYIHAHGRRIRYHTNKYYTGTWKMN